MNRSSALVLVFVVGFFSPQVMAQKTSPHGHLRECGDQSPLGRHSLLTFLEKLQAYAEVLKRAKGRNEQGETPPSG